MVSFRLLFKWSIWLDKWRCKKLEAFLLTENQTCFYKESMSETSKKLIVMSCAQTLQYNLWWLVSTLKGNQTLIDSFLFLDILIHTTNRNYQSKANQIINSCTNLCFETKDCYYLFSIDVFIVLLESFSAFSMHKQRKRGV